MDTKYQLVTIGHDVPLKERTVRTFFDRIAELGLSADAISLLDSSSYFASRVNNAPTVAVYFGDGQASHPDGSILTDLLDQAAFILPAVENLSGFASQIPSSLHGINGIQLQSPLDVDPLVSSILEGFSLLRTSRRVFISYRRAESTAAAIQLFEALERAGFDVFLDTHSVRPGDKFQEELWHRLADTDVVILLNTPGFARSHWTMEELARASGMSIAILQVTWPENSPLDTSQLTTQFDLNPNDFEGRYLSGSDSRLTGLTMERLVPTVESLRARALGARQDNLVTVFKRFAVSTGVLINLQPEKYITFEDNAAVIPTVGVPTAFGYNQSGERIKQALSDREYEVFLLYDHINIREAWLKHLDWLDQHLPIKSIKITDAETWLRNRF